MPLSSSSTRRMAGVKPTLVRVVTLAAERCRLNVSVTEGVRTLKRQQELYAQGRTAPGKIVTGTMNSKHLTGDAVDLAPIGPDGQIDWNDVKSFKEIGRCMFEAAKSIGVKIRWGYDWDGDGILQEKGEYDGPHFELVP